ncbi:MAG: hypothetical protein JJ863_00805 [Deltaproteobacteria bacterium]|nr:hypothetical protein [Deltaproteobacteria bacterium]
MNPLSTRSYAALVAHVAQLIEISADELGPDDSLVDWGLDSLRLMSLVEAFEASGVPVEFLDLVEQPTLRHYASLLGATDVPS